ncbi:hypothetical protein VPH35_031554 [Triticum aestivum]
MEQLAAHSERHVRTFPVTQHVPEILVQIRRRNHDRIGLDVLGAGLLGDGEQAPDGEAVVLEEGRALDLGLLDELDEAPIVARRRECVLHVGVGYLGEAAVVLHEVEGEPGPDVLVAAAVVEEGGGVAEAVGGGAVRVEPDGPVEAADGEDAGADEPADAHAVEQRVARDPEVVDGGDRVRHAHRRRLGQAVARREGGEFAVITHGRRRRRSRGRADDYQRRGFWSRASPRALQGRADRSRLPQRRAPAADRRASGETTIGEPARGGSVEVGAEVNSSQA